LEAKICPDGTSVGRTGPNCEFAACPSATPNPTAEWTDFSSKYFTLSFKVPSGYSVEDSANIILIGKSPILHPEIGGDNAFFRLERYSVSTTKNSVLRSIQALQKDPQGIGRGTISSVEMGSVVVDGSSFTSYIVHYTQGGTEFGAIFDASHLTFTIAKGEDDISSIGYQILSTFKFSRIISVALCSGILSSGGMGGTGYPIAEKYSALGGLGAYFTAEDCSPQRLAEVIKGQYPRPESITLKSSPSAALVSALQQAGLAPSSEKCANTPAASCKSWRTLHEQDLVPLNLLKLRPFIDVIESVECYFCG
jgi:hypothetical protein